MDKHKLKALMTDFKRFAYTFLAVSVFLYIGMIIPAQEMNDTLLIIATSLFLICSFFCFQKAIKYKKQLDQIDENENMPN